MNQSQCSEIQELLSALIDGEATAEESARAEQHRLSCPRCAEEFNRLRVSVERLADLPRHPVPASFAGSVLQRVAGEGGGGAAPGNGRAGALRSRGGALGAGYAHWYQHPAAVAALLLFGVALAIAYCEIRIAPARELTARLQSFEEDVSSRMERAAVRLDEMTAEVAGMAGQVTGMAGEARETLALFRERIDGLEKELATAEGARNSALEALRVRSAETELELQGLRDTNAALASEVATLGGILESMQHQLAAASQTGGGEIAASAANPPGQGSAKRAIPPAAARKSPGAGDVARELALEGVPAVQMLVEGDKYVLKPDWGNPETIPTLFAIYESGDPNWKSLAFRLLDDHFRENAGALVREHSRKEQERGVGRVLGDFFGGNEPPPPPPSLSEQERETVRLYKEYWRRSGSPVRDSSKTRDEE